MKAISIRVLVALVTFTLGVVIAAVWMIDRIPQQNVEPVDLEVGVLHPPMQPPACFPGLSVKVITSRTSKDGYFPQGIFAKDPRVDEPVARWYSLELNLLNEPTLLSPDERPIEVYRFLYMRSFQPAIAVRIWLEGETRMLAVKQLRCANENESSTLQVDQTRSLTPEEWQTLGMLADSACFWGMPTTTDDPIAHDGAWWVFEGAWEDRYHVTQRQSPADGSYRELCLYMLKLAGLPLKESEIY